MSIAHRDYIRPTKAEIIAMLRQLNCLGTVDAKDTDLDTLHHHSRRAIAVMLQDLDPADRVAERATLLRALDNPAMAQRLNTSVLVQLARKAGKL